MKKIFKAIREWLQLVLVALVLLEAFAVQDVPREVEVAAPAFSQRCAASTKGNVAINKKTS